MSHPIECFHRSVHSPHSQLFMNAHHSSRIDRLPAFSFVVGPIWSAPIFSTALSGGASPGLSTILAHLVMPAQVPAAVCQSLADRERSWCRNATHTAHVTSRELREGDLPAAIQQRTPERHCLRRETGLHRHRPFPWTTRSGDELDLQCR